MTESEASKDAKDHVGDADRERMMRNMLHAVQVQEGLIPPDSPPDFTVPQPLDDKGLPWWFGPDYMPTPRPWPSSPSQ